MRNNKMNLSDRMTHFYIKNIKKWMPCPVCGEKLYISKDGELWECSQCHYQLSDTEFCNDFVFWFCDGCNTYLNVQEGFDRESKRWTCVKCGFENVITESNIKGECKDCGVLLDNPNATICEECKIARMEKAKIILEGISDICYQTASILDTVSGSDEESECDNYEYFTENENCTNSTDHICSCCGKTFDLTSARRKIGRYYGAGTYNDYYPNGDICTDCAIAEISCDVATGEEIAELMGDSWDD